MRGFLGAGHQVGAACPQAGSFFPDFPYTGAMRIITSTYNFGRTVVPTNGFAIARLACAGAFLLLASSVPAQNLFVGTQGGGTGFGPYGVDTIVQITPDGSQSTFASGLNLPTGLAFNSAGNLFEADAYSGNIYEFTPAGVQTTFVSGLGLDQPQGLAFDSAGDLYEAELYTGQLNRFTPGGVETTIATGLSPSAIAIDRFGNIFVADHGSIDEFTSGGLKTTFATGLNPFGLAFDHAGNLFVTDGSANIYEYTPSGVRTTFASGLITPDGLAFNNAGDLFVTSSDSGDIYEFTPSGAESVFASGLNSPGYLAIQGGITFAAVPEPAVFGSVGGIMLLAVSFRKAWFAGFCDRLRQRSTII